MKDTERKRLYAVSNAHLDTQWNWTIKDTIVDCVKNTMEYNFKLFEKYPSEKEGIKLVKKTASYICKNGKVWMLVPLFWKSGCKYVGYFLGKRYDKLPRRLDKGLSLDKEYWNRTESKEEN